LTEPLAPDSAPETEAIAPRPLALSTLQIAGWHGAWAVLVFFGGLVLAMMGRIDAATTDLALLVAAVPGVVGVFLLKEDGLWRRTALLAVWAVCGTLASLLTGGAGGPLAIWTLTPIAVAAGMGRTGLIAKAGAFSLAGLIAATLLPFLGLASPIPAFAPLLAIFGLATTAAGLAGGLVLARRRTWEALSRADQRVVRQDDLLAGQPNLILLLTTTGRVSLYHGAPPRGVSLDNLVETGLASAITPQDWPSVEQALQNAVQAGDAHVGFAPVSAPGVWLELDLKSRGDGRLVGVLHDATAVRAQLETAEAARAEAESLAAGRANFLASMSHELRTPLNAIMGFSDIMRNRMFGDLPGKYQEYADLIHDSGAHLLDLINDVLDMSKIEARRYELHREILDPREPVSAALRILRLQADEAGIALRAALPSVALEADVDRRAVKQIVLNLVANALKFTPQGGSVTVTLSGQGDVLDLTVTDTGAGIALDDMARLGRPYEQAGDSDKRAMGTGLGLSLVRAFAELHGGELIIESTLGHGASFSVRLPVLQPAASKPAPSPGGNVVAFNPQR
jgi:cell cycle sensor histidine kinase DivJ